MKPTLIQLLASSSIIASSRVQRAVVHWGTLTFVGSVRTRERYIRLAALPGASVTIKQSEDVQLRGTEMGMGMRDGGHTFRSVFRDACDVKRISDPTLHVVLDLVDHVEDQLRKNTEVVCRLEGRG